MTKEQKAAYAELMDISSALHRLLTHDRSPDRELTLPASTVAQLHEAISAVHEAQRTMERELL